MSRGVYTSLVVDSAKVISRPNKKLSSYSGELDKDWRYLLSNNEVSYTRTMSANFNMITGLDPWGRNFVKSIFYNKSRHPDKLATWRLFRSAADRVYGRIYTAYGYTTVDKDVVQLRITEVDANDLLLISPHFVIYEGDEETPTYVV